MMHHSAHAVVCRSFLCGALGLGLFAPAAFAQSCQPAWSAAPAAEFDARINAIVVFDDGTGPALYAGGEFTHIDGSPVPHIAKWDGTSWSPVGGGLAVKVNDLEVFDWGDGPRLIVSGTGYLFDESSLVMWDGESWAAVPELPINSWTGGMGVSDIGGEPELYVGMPATGYIRRWNGETWRTVGDGLVTTAADFAEFDDGSGTVLLAGGFFAALMRFDGTAWDEVGGGRTMNGEISAMQVFDDGSGPALYMGGGFTRVPGLSNVLRVARWDGTTWSPVGTGFDGSVRGLAVFDDGDGPALYAAGEFTHAGSTPVNHIARWDGTSWNALGDGLDGPVAALAVMPDSDTLTGGLVAAGPFTTAGGLASPGVAVWAGCACVADFNHDGTVDTLDVLHFLNAWTSGQSGADINGDGNVNTLDVLAFLNAWSAGCP